MIITAASGKGGTGKITITSNLVWAAPESVNVQLIGCHV